MTGKEIAITFVTDKSRKAKGFRLTWKGNLSHKYENTTNMVSLIFCFYKYSSSINSTFTVTNTYHDFNNSNDDYNIKNNNDNTDDNTCENDYIVDNTGNNNNTDDNTFNTKDKFDHNLLQHLSIHHMYRQCFIV